MYPNPIQNDTRMKGCRVLHWSGTSGNKLAVVHVDSSRSDNDAIGICDNQITTSMLYVVEEENRNGMKSSAVVT